MEGTALNILNTYGLFLAFFAFFTALFFSITYWARIVVIVFKVFTIILAIAATLIGAVAIYLLNTDENLWSTRISSISVVPVLLIVVGITMLGAWMVAAVTIKYKKQ